MSVANTHAQYDDNKWKWKRCRDIIAGKDAMIQNGKSAERYFGSVYDPRSTNNLYLPRLTYQSDAEYLAYADRASFFNATGRTLDAMTGLIFSKDPMWKLPTAIEPYADDITLSGTNLREFSEQLVEQQLAVGRVGVMVDYPSDAPIGITVAEAERQNIRPFMRWYAAENIINWRTATINGAETLVLVVLSEDVEIQRDIFTVEVERRYRVLQLTPEGYMVSVYAENGDILAQTIPMQMGAPLRYIPFTILGANSCDADVQKPPMLDLVDANIGHYRNAADYEHGLHFTGLPTPYVSGVQLQDGQVLPLGSTNAWVFPDPQAKASFLEFTGDGLKTIREAMKDKEHRMAVLGARMLADDKRTAEAFGTIELKTAGERSVLASISRAASDAMVRCLNWMAAWVGAPQEAEFSLNTDYGASRMEPQMLTALVGAYQNDVIPMSVVFENLQRGELVRPDMDLETYEAELSNQGPDLSLEQPTANVADQQTFMQGLKEKLGL